MMLPNVCYVQGCNDSVLCCMNTLHTFASLQMASEAPASQSDAMPQAASSADGKVASSVPRRTIEFNDLFVYADGSLADHAIAVLRYWGTRDAWPQGEFPESSGINMLYCDEESIEDGQGNLVTPCAVFCLEDHSEEEQEKLIRALNRRSTTLRFFSFENKKYGNVVAVVQRDQPATPGSVKHQLTASASAQGSIQQGVAKRSRAAGDDSSSYDDEADASEGDEAGDGDA